MAKYTYRITEKFSGFSVLDYYRYFYLSKSKIGLIRQNSFVNNVKVYENHLLKKDDLLSFTIEETKFVEPLKLSLKVVYEDKNFLIIDKPRDMIVHSDGVNTNKTLVNAVRFYFDKIGLKVPVRYCHRLDFETTGIIIFVKDPLTNSYMNELISHHKVTRDYLAIVSGIINGSGIINKKIGKDRHHNSRRRVSPKGLDAVTNYEVISKMKRCALVKLRLETGRTHQIRVHMKYIGHPLVGDSLYEGNSTIGKKLMLQSYHLEFVNPYNDKTVDLTLPLRQDMQKIVDTK